MRGRGRGGRQPPKADQRENLGLLDVGDADLHLVLPDLHAGSVADRSDTPASDCGGRRGVEPHAVGGTKVIEVDLLTGGTGSLLRRVGGAHLPRQGEAAVNDQPGKQEQPGH